MSYEKAMRHSHNVRKLKKQARQFMGFDARSTPWPNPRRNPETRAYITVREWFKDRHHGDPQHNRECIRDEIANLRRIRAARR